HSNHPGRIANSRDHPDEQFRYHPHVSYFGPVGFPLLDSVVSVAPVKSSFVLTEIKVRFLPVVSDAAGQRDIAFGLTVVIRRLFLDGCLSQGVGAKSVNLCSGDKAEVDCRCFLKPKNSLPANGKRNFAVRNATLDYRFSASSTAASLS
ncbi:MAG: hypothetical protein WBV71_04790, partial [Roseobacter sp.]